MRIAALSAVATAVASSSSSSLQPELHAPATSSLTLLTEPHELHLSRMYVSEGNSTDCGVDSMQRHANGTETMAPLHHEFREPPPMPASIDALIRDSAAELDEDGPMMIAHISSKPAFTYIPHARATFKEHLVGTFGVLAAWGQPVDVRRCGLVHTAYSGDLFQFYVYDAGNETDRGVVRSVVGEEAERLTWLFGTVQRGALLRLADVMSGALERAGEMGADPEAATRVRHRLGGEINVTNSEIAKMIIVTLADYLEQMVEVNGWRDHHQVDAPLRLYPGDGRPAIAMHWISRMCLAVRDHLDAIPPIFGRCTRTISHAEEVGARDAYWKVVTDEDTLLEAEQLALLAEAARRNPFVGEPLLLLAQLHFRNGRHALAAEACAAALERFYDMATAWDKRRSYANWVGFARMLYLRATRMARGLPSLPFNEALPRTSGGLQLTSIEDIAAEMP